jgi:uncharacterized protein YrzB (UPF0473 family)
MGSSCQNNYKPSGQSKNRSFEGVKQMDPNEMRDRITIEDENGATKDYSVEALFDMEDHSYALLTSTEDTLLMRVEDEEDGQYLVGITDPEERDSILHAYEIAVDANPAD